MVILLVHYWVENSSKNDLKFFEQKNFGQKNFRLRRSAVPNRNFGCHNFNFQGWIFFLFSRHCNFKIVKQFMVFRKWNVWINRMTLFKWNITRFEFQKNSKFQKLFLSLNWHNISHEICQALANEELEFHAQGLYFVNS